jgi:hypothetical protein
MIEYNLLIICKTQAVNAYCQFVFFCITYKIFLAQFQRYEHQLWPHLIYSLQSGNLLTRQLIKSVIRPTIYQCYILRLFLPVLQFLQQGRPRQFFLFIQRVLINHHISTN